MPSFFGGYKTVWLACITFFFATCGFAQDAEVKAPAVSNAIVASGANVEQQKDDKAGDDEELSRLKDPFESAFPKKQEPESRVQVNEETVSNEETEVKEEFDYSSLKVSGLVWGEAKPKVIINDTVYGIGDEINGAKIIKITKEGITFKYKNNDFLMKREGSSIKEQGGK